MKRNGLAIGLLVFGFALVNPVGGNASAQKPASKANPAPKPEPQPSELSTIKDALERAVRALEAQKDDAKATRDEQRAGDDLNAQQGMERWALGMLIATIASVVISFVGLALLFKNLNKVNQANRLVELGVLETREIGETENRAYVHAEACVMRWDGGRRCEVVLTFRNTGATPAVNVRDRLEFKGTWEPKAWLDGGSARSAIAGGVALPCRSELTNVERGNLLENWADNSGPIHIKGHVYYEDIFGTKFRSGFAFIFRSGPHGDFTQPNVFAQFEFEAFPLFQEAPEAMQSDRLKRRRAARAKLEAYEGEKN